LASAVVVQDDGLDAVLQPRPRRAYPLGCSASGIVASVQSPRRTIEWSIVIRAPDPTIMLTALFTMRARAADPRDALGSQPDGLETQSENDRDVTCHAVDVLHLTTG
jgi:hypothetical protein